MTRSYFEKEKGWESPMRQRFSRIVGAIAADKNLAQGAAIDLLRELGSRYRAIWPETMINYSTFYDCMWEAVDGRGWWTTHPPNLFGSTDRDAHAIAGVVEHALTLFTRRGDHRNYSLLTKWLHFCFPDTFAIYDSQAAMSIEVAIRSVALAPRHANLDRDRFRRERIGDTSGSGYLDLLNFYRLFWEAAGSAGLDADLRVVADEIERLLRGEPGCPDARVSPPDILDKLLWKANGAMTPLGLGGSTLNMEG
jgi:hypothetical protein